MAENFGGCVEFKHINGDTAAIVFNDCGYSDSAQSPLAKFIIEFIKMRRLLYDGTIAEDLFDMWLDKTYKDLNCPLPPLIYCK